jgi:DNA-binding CsgD family transcriptional regulator
MALLTSDRVVVAINKAFAEDLGYQPNAAVGQRADLFIAPSWTTQLDRDWAGLRETGRLTGERELVRADGRHVRVQFAADSEQVSGRWRVLYVVLDLRLRPATLDLADRTSDKPLTPRELEVVGEIAMGRRWHQIAADLFISQSTVKTHVRNAMHKLGARSQAQLVAIALVNGMLDAGRLGMQASG